MAMEDLISLQSEGLRSIGEPTAPRPSGVQQGSVLVVLDVNKPAVAPAAVYWALGNVVRKGDHLKILGIITHLPNPMGFMVRVDQSTRSNPNIMELQFEIVTKKEAIWRTAFLKEWCAKAGVKLEVDVKAGNNPKVIVIDEAKAMGAYHVVLDKSMKDRKYFIDNLSCFVSRIRSNGGVDTLRSFAMYSKLPPMAPTTPKKTANSNSESAARHRSKPSTGSTASSSSYRGGSSMSSTSFELGGSESSDDFSTQEGDPVSIPSTSTSDSMDPPQGPQVPQLTIRINPQPPNQVYNLLRSAVDAENKNFNFNVNNPLSKPAVRNWLNEDQGSHRISNVSEIDVEEPGPLTPRTEFRFEQGPVQRFRQRAGSNGWIGQLSVAPEFAGPCKTSMGRPALLQTQVSFNTGRRKQYFRNDKLSMDMHWPLMHWVDCRAMKLRSQHTSSSAAMISSSSNSSLNNFRGRRRIPVSSLNYSDMVDSD